MTDFVYFIRCPANSTMKIGHAVDPSTRLSNLQIGSAHTLELYAIMPVDNGARVEAELHAMFAHARIRGEWFACHADILTFAEDIAAKNGGRPPPPKAPGRPSLSGKGIAARIEIKLAPDERLRWIAAADQQGLTLSEWLREAGELAIARGSTR